MLSEEQKQQIRAFWHSFHRRNGFTEIRIIKGGQGRNRTYSGYYKDVEKFIYDLEYTGNELASAYFVFNDIKEPLYDRTQMENLVSGIKTTEDNDIQFYNYVLLDIDAIRETDTNSTQEQKAYARAKAGQVFKYLRGMGFENMTVDDSANGYHIFIPCDFQNTPDNVKMVKRFTQAIAVLFSDEKPTDGRPAAEIDLKVYNPARIAKIPGTYSDKGSPTSTERPRRMCRVTRQMSPWVPNRKAYFEKVAEQYPEEQPVPDKYNHFSTQRFDLDDFIQKHAIPVREVKEVAEGKRYILEHCLFDPSHKGKDAMIFQHRDGGIGYFCFHNSCSHYKWRDVRLLYEPDAYDRRDVEEFRSRRDYYSKTAPAPVIVPESAEKGKKWLDPTDIIWRDPKDDIHIPSGFVEIDKYMGGWCLPDTTVITGSPGSGKSVFANMLVLNAVNRGYKVGQWSGELIPSRFMNWLDQAAAGLQYVQLKEGFDDWYHTPRNVSEQIRRWLNGKFFLYNNDYGSNESQIFADMESLVHQGVQLFILDNLAAMSLDSSGDELQKQREFINVCNDFSKRFMVHIIIIIHPRKEQGNGLIRMESIGGAKELYGLASNAIVIHRCTEDFWKRSREYFGAKKMQDYEDFNSVVEVFKNREQGQQDKLFGLYYEPKTRRFKNEPAEYIHYGWEDESEIAPLNPAPVPIPKPEEIVESVPMPANTWFNQESRELEEWEK